MIGAVQRPIPFQVLFGDNGVRFDARKMQWIGSTTNELGVVVAWRTAPQKTYPLPPAGPGTPPTGAPVPPQWQLASQSLSWPDLAR